MAVTKAALRQQTTEVQNSMTASTTLAPSVTATNTAINAKVENNLTASTTVAPSKTAVSTAIDAKVVNNLTASTTVAPSKTAVNDALALKQDLNPAIVANTGNYTLILTDNGKTITQNSASTQNLTIPQNSSVAFPIGTTIVVIQIGAGQTTIVAGTGSTVHSSAGLKIRAQWGTVTLLKIATNTWVVSGDTTT